MATQNEPGPSDQEEIPPLTSISPAIIVPTNRDFTKTPPPMLDDPAVCVEATIDALEWHAARVEENMIKMLMREAERIKRVGQIERAQYDAYGRPIREPPTQTESELKLEGIILREDEAVVRRILTDRRFHENEDTASGGNGPWAAPRGPGDPAYADLATLRREKLFRRDVDESRLTPRTAALMHVINLAKYGWDEQIEGHRAAVEKEKQTRRAEVREQMGGNIIAPATSAPTPRQSLGGPDPMDLDQ
ncbi:hypothetical protein F4777DRAFT_532386 [Nemania sp. FL0916]|nr:hypothetical protein F4777DRAFT_532386 [Nemania sp. FL0916]